MQQPLATEIEKIVKEYLANSGLEVNRVENSEMPSDIVVSDPSQGKKYCIEIKVGPGDRFLPFSGYAQAAQLKANDRSLQPILFTNLAISDSIAKLLEQDQIPVVHFASGVLPSDAVLGELKGRISGAANLSAGDLPNLQPA